MMIDFLRSCRESKRHYHSIGVSWARARASTHTYIPERAAIASASLPYQTHACLIFVPIYIHCRVKERPNLIRDWHAPVKQVSPCAIRTKHDGSENETNTFGV